MRRPQGFDQPPVRRPSAPAAATGAAGAETRKPTSAGAGAGRVAVDQAEPAARAGQVGATPTPDAAPRAARSPIDASVGGGAAPSPGSSQPAELPDPADERAMRRAVAKAARERRRFERQEVRRFTARSRRRRITWGIAIGAVLVVAAGTLAVAYSPLMALRVVRVEGVQRIPAAEVVAAFDEDLGTPLALVGADDVQRALRGFRLIETYSIETIPPETIVVRIQERSPVGVIEVDGGLELVDAAGVVIDRPDTRPDGQPLISAGPVVSEGFRAAAAVIRNLPADVRGQVVAASAETADDVRLELAGGASVVWGSAEQSTLKSTVLATLMQRSPPDTVAVYDVSAPMSPVIG